MLPLIIQMRRPIKGIALLGTVGKIERVRDQNEGGDDGLLSVTSEESVSMLIYVDSQKSYFLTSNPNTIFREKEPNVEIHSHH